MSQIRVAIVGGGIAGALLMNGLRMHEHLECHIFESRPVFKEEGAAININLNGTRAFKAISPRVLDLFVQAGAVESKSWIPLLSAGPQAGQIIGEMPEPDYQEGEYKSGACARQPFLAALLADIPEQYMHPNKKLERIIEPASSSSDGATSSHEPYRLSFSDRAEMSFDVIIGADGIHSRMQKYVLGEDHPAASPVPTGEWHVPLLVPAEPAKKLLGEFVDEKDSRTRGWVGDGTFMMLNFVDNMKTLQIIIASADEEVKLTNDWSREISYEELRDRFAGQIPQLSSRLAQLIKEETKGPMIAFCTKEHPHAPTFVKGRVCLMGDAAHAMCPAQASGGGMAAEDALALTTLFGEVKSISDVPIAFQAYDQMRLSRTRAVADRGRYVSEILRGCVSLEKDVLQDILLNSWDFIINWDVGNSIDQSKEAFRDLQKSRAITA